jgi:hypothetical protein
MFAISHQQTVNPQQTLILKLQAPFNKRMQSLENKNEGGTEVISTPQ